MTFESDFPSLKFMTTSATDREGTTEEIVMCSSVALHCLDKARVREAILKCMKDYQRYDGEYAGMLSGDELLKELGL